MVCPTPFPDFCNTGNSRLRQKQHGIFLFWSFSSFTQKIEILNTLKHRCFANLISLRSSIPKFCQNQSSCSKCFDFCQQNQFQQNMVLPKCPQADFMFNLVSVAQLSKWDRRKELAADLELPGNSQDENPSGSKVPWVTLPFEWSHENLYWHLTAKVDTQLQSTDFAQELEIKHVYFSWFITIQI